MGGCHNRERSAQGLAFTLAYRDAQAAVRAVIELPDPKIDHFVARTMEHGGRLSKTRRKRDFPNLRDEELERNGNRGAGRDDGARHDNAVMACRWSPPMWTHATRSSEEPALTWMRTDGDAAVPLR